MKKLFLLFALLHAGNCTLWSASIQPSKIPSTPVSPHLAALLDGSDSSSDDEDDFLTTGTRATVDRTELRSQLDAILAEGSPSTSPTNSPKQPASRATPSQLIRTGTTRLRGITDTDITATSSTSSASSGESTPTSTPPQRNKPQLPSKINSPSYSRAKRQMSRAQSVAESEGLRRPFVEKHQAIFGATVCSTSHPKESGYFVAHKKAVEKIHQQLPATYRPLCLVTPQSNSGQQTQWTHRLKAAPLKEGRISDADKKLHDDAMDALIIKLPRGSFIVDTVYTDDKPIFVTYLNEQDKKELAESFDLARLDLVYQTLLQAANTLQQPQPTTTQGTIKQKIKLDLPQEVIFDDMPILIAQHLMRNFDIVRHDGTAWLPKAIAATLATTPHPKASSSTFKTPAKK